MYSADEVIGEFRLVRPIGEGVLGVVWRARRLDRDDEVALKLVHPDRVPRSARKRAYDALISALTRTGRLEHPNLQSLAGLAFRPEDGAFGVAARHYEGGPFEHLGNIGRRDTLLKALGLLRQIAEALAWLHERDLVHGNLKPSNALVTPDRAGPRVIVTDLCWSQAGLGRRTEATRIFVSPEQLAKQSPTPASDQWATARMMHQLAVRASPGKSATEALTQLPLPVLRVLKRALETEPRARFASMTSFLQALEHAEEELGSAGASLPAALPTPTLEVSVSDALSVKEDETSPLRRPDPSEIRTEAPEGPLESPRFEPPEPSGDLSPPGLTEAAEAPTPQAFEPIREAPTEPGMPKPPVVRAATEEEAWAADPSADQADPTTPVSVQAINPSDEREDVTRRKGPLKPSDPTDVLPAVQPERSGGPGKRLALTVIALVIIAGSAAVLWKNQDPTEAPVATAAPSPGAAGAPPSAAPPDEERGAAEPSAEAEPREATPAVAEAPAARPKRAAKAPPADPEPDDRAGARALVASAAASLPPPEADPLADLRAACEARGRSACQRLGEAYLEGEGVERSAAKARRWLARACDLRSISACERAGALFAATGRSRDDRLARRYYERACDAGRGAACSELAELWAAGRGGSSNPRTAQAFANRACQLGHRSSCE